MFSCLVFSNFSVSVVSQFVRDMKRSDHVSLCTTTPSSITSSNNSSNNGGKKLRKRRELNAMAAPHVIVRSSQQSNNSSNRSGNKKSDYKSIYFSNSSSNNNEDDGWCFFYICFPKFLQFWLLSVEKITLITILIIELSSVFGGSTLDKERCSGADKLSQGNVVQQKPDDRIKPDRSF